MSHQINSLSKSQNEKLAADLQTGQAIVKHFCNFTGKMTATRLDEAFKAWSGNPGNFTGEQIASGLGTLLGELIRQDFSFSWKMIDDEMGSEPALLDDASGSIVFPINSVWKRIDPEINSEPFFAPMYQAIKLHIEKEKGKN
ncbi:MAG: DUF3806 domain-containing protein [Candidatus Riflebacteria bacterium]